MQKYIVKEKFEPLCCGNKFFIGQILEIYAKPSKNRLYINAYEKDGKLRGSHNVKRSTFFRCCDEII